jgi:hypothetical protein
MIRNIGVHEGGMSDHSGRWCCRWLSVSYSCSADVSGTSRVAVLIAPGFPLDVQKKPVMGTPHVDLEWLCCSGVWT